MKQTVYHCFFITIFSSQGIICLSKDNCNISLIYEAGMHDCHIFSLLWKEMQLRKVNILCYIVWHHPKWFSFKSTTTFKSFQSKRNETNALCSTKICTVCVASFSEPRSYSQTQSDSWLSLNLSFCINSLKQKKTPIRGNL